MVAKSVSSDSAVAPAGLIVMWWPSKEEKMRAERERDHCIQMVRKQMSVESSSSAIEVIPLGGQR